MQSRFIIPYDDGVLFRMTPNVPGPSSFYGFGSKYAQNPGEWELSHLPTGNWDGSGCPHLRILANDPAPGSDVQFNLGFHSPDIDYPWQVGDSMFVRIILKYDDDSRLLFESSSGNKLVDIGQAGNSRHILFQHPCHTTRGCTLNYQHYGSLTPSPTFEFITPEDFGLGSIDWDDASIIDKYWSHQVHIGIEQPHCTPGVLATYPSNPTQGTPAANSAVTVNGFSFIQYEVRSGGTSGQPYFKLWLNNNNYATPSSQQLGMLTTLGVTAWNSSITVGGFWNQDAGDSNPFGFLIGGFEIGRTFAPNWYPA